MKKTFLARRNRLLSGRSFSWGFWALLFVLAALMVRLIAPNLFLHTFAPVMNVSNTLGAETHAFLERFNNASALALKNEALTRDNITLATKNQVLENKVADFTKLLGTHAQSNAEGILVGVVARPPQSPYDTLVLSGGTDDGVLLGMEAFANENVPIGIVSGVAKDFSRVTLFSAAYMSVGGWVGTAHAPVTILGMGGGAMEASVSRDTGVSVGDVVFAPGPGLLPLGTIAHIDTDPLSPSVKLRIAPAVNLFSVAWVALRATGNVPMTFATSTTP